MPNRLTLPIANSTVMIPGERVQVSVNAEWLRKAKEILEVEEDEEAIDRAVARYVGHVILKRMDEARGNIEFFDDDAFDRQTPTALVDDRR